MEETVAVVGSRGLRSVGKIAIDYMIEKLKPKLVTEIHSPHFPIIYDTQPSYAPRPNYPGKPGVLVENSTIVLPRIQFYLSDAPRLLLTRGYHANFKGQYSVAEQVVDVFQQHNVKRVFVLAGYGSGEGEICCAATDPELVEEFKAMGIGTSYEGPFIGFSGLVLGAAKMRGIKGVCLFGRSQPNLEDPEFPDPLAARKVLEKLGGILNLSMDLSGLDEKRDYRSEPELIGW
jgi:proteasome assembly chaperone (PAC2) family protein